MRNKTLIKLLLLAVINTIFILGGTHAEHMSPEAKNEPVEDLEKDDLPDPIFFASFLYQ